MILLDDRKLGERSDGDGEVYSQQQDYEGRHFGTVALPLYALLDSNGIRLTLRLSSPGMQTSSWRLWRKLSKDGCVNVLIARASSSAIGKIFIHVSTEVRNTFIVESGCSGLTAAIYAA